MFWVWICSEIICRFTHKCYLVDKVGIVDCAIRCITCVHSHVGDEITVRICPKASVATCINQWYDCMIVWLQIKGHMTQILHLMTINVSFIYRIFWELLPSISFFSSFRFVAIIANTSPGVEHSLSLAQEWLGHAIVLYVFCILGIAMRINATNYYCCLYETGDCSFELVMWFRDLSV